MYCRQLKQYFTSIAEAYCVNAAEIQMCRESSNVLRNSGHRNLGIEPGRFSRSPQIHEVDFKFTFVIRNKGYPGFRRLRKPMKQEKRVAFSVHFGINVLTVNQSGLGCLRSERGIDHDITVRILHLLMPHSYNESHSDVGYKQ